jgi:hypothetical protein
MKDRRQATGVREWDVTVEVRLVVRANSELNAKLRAGTALYESLHHAAGVVLRGQDVLCVSEATQA